MASSRDKQQIEFRGICLSGPFKNQEIEGKINLSLNDSVRLTQKSSSNYNRRSSQQNYSDRDDRDDYNYREERYNSGYYERSSRYREIAEDEDSGDGMQLLIVLFGLIFLVNLVAGQFISSGNSSADEKVSPTYQFNADYYNSY